ncbi:MAG: RNA 2',3'-cyclic phosphodiesterase [Planctomycetota bacterium]|jgi:2'-5' RNA ligase
MARPLRTFVAFSCDAGVCKRLRRQAERLGDLERVFRAPATDDFHLTLQFLGDTEEQDVPAIGRALRAAAAAAEPVAVRYGGLGAFPNAARARVVWAGVSEVEAPGALSDLARAVGRELRPLGFPPESRRYHPHVTLGRLRGRPGPALVEAVEAGRDLDLGQEVLSDLKLILSDPSGGRYRYINLTTVVLGAEDPGSGAREAGDPA